jgi:IS5 family transposase
MKQSSFDLSLSTRRTRKQVFLQQMDTVVPWADLVDLIAPYYSEGRTGRPPFALETMLRVHFMQQWFSLSDPAMEDAFFDTPLYREFAQLDASVKPPDESTILRFRHRLERHKLADQILATVRKLLEQRGLLLKVGTAVDATADCSAQFHQEQRQGARSRDAFEPKGQRMALWHESPYWRGRRLGPGAHRARHLGQRGRCHRGQQLAAQTRNRCVRGRGLPTLETASSQPENSVS